MYRIFWAAAIMAGLGSSSPLLAMEHTTRPEVSPGPAATYRSAFERFKPFEQNREPDWVGANERVRETGGHGGALAEEEPDTGGTRTADPHAGHRQ